MQRAEEGVVFVDVGAAEGIMGLECLNKASQIYLIEGEDQWTDKLEKTFNKYRNVTIINKYASSHDDENHISLDSLLKEVKAPILIKIDVEGMEREVLDGAVETLKREDVKIVVAAYHKPDDDRMLKQHLEKFGFETEFSEGYIAMMRNDTVPPYLRRGVIRAWKR